MLQSNIESLIHAYPVGTYFQLRPTSSHISAHVAFRCSEILVNRVFITTLRHSETAVLYDISVHRNAERMLAYFALDL